MPSKSPKKKKDKKAKRAASTSKKRRGSIMKTDGSKTPRKTPRGSRKKSRRKTRKYESPEDAILAMDLKKLPEIKYDQFNLQKREQVKWEENLQ